jgi:hypothetical protein
MRKKRHYKLAYLIMIDGPSTRIKNLKYLVNLLDDGSAIVMIHVDLGSVSLYDRTLRWLSYRNQLKTQSGHDVNVYLSHSRHRGMWAHVSLIRMQLSGFWELYDLAEWDHLINLSAMDLPLRSSRELARLLGQEKYKDKVMIEHFLEDDNLASRLVNPQLPRKGINSDRYL